MAVDLTKHLTFSASTPGDSAHTRGTQTQAADIVGAVSRKFCLSCQEANVLMAASRGETKKEIAFALGITVRTVEYYWTQIFRKLNCGSQIAVMALLFRCATDAHDPGIY